MQSWPLDPSLLILVQADTLVRHIAIIEAISYAAGYMTTWQVLWMPELVHQSHANPHTSPSDEMDVWPEVRQCTQQPRISSNMLCMMLDARTCSTC